MFFLWRVPGLVRCWGESGVAFDLFSGCVFVFVFVVSVLGGVASILFVIGPSLDVLLG